MIKRLFFYAVVFSLMLLCFSQISLAEPVKDWKDVYRLARSFGGGDGEPAMEKALRMVVKQQKSRHNRNVDVVRPVDFRVLGAAHASVAVSTLLKKAGSARSKGIPAVFVILFRKEAGALKYENEHLIQFTGVKKVKVYSGLDDGALISLFKKEGVQFATVAAKVKPKKGKPSEKVVLSGSDIQKGVVAEPYIDSAITRDNELKHALAGYVKKGEIPKVMPVKANAGSPQLQMKVAALEARVKQLEALLSHVTRKGGNLYFNGVNIYLTNGSGQTAKLNGKGNLILGYGSTGKGSHNLVVGSKNRYEGFAGIVSGRENVLMGNCGVVLGGESNEVVGDFSVITGGQNNRAPGTFASILGGKKNTAKGEFASINGQSGRTKGGKNPHFTGKKTKK